MAEIGAAASVIGILSFAGQLHSGIRTLREICKYAAEAEEQVSLLTKKVEALTHLLSYFDDATLPDSNFALTSYVEHSRLCCHKVVSLFAKVEEKLQPRFKSKLKQKLTKVAILQYWKEDLKDLELKIQQAESSLLM